MQRAHKTADIKDGYFGLNVKKSSYKRNINKEKKSSSKNFYILIKNSLKNLKLENINS